MAKRTLSPELAPAAALLQQGRLADATRACEDVLRRRPRDVDAHQMLGLIESRVGRFDRAIEHFRNGLDIEPDDLVLRCGLAMAYVATGAYTEAIDEFDGVLKTEPEYGPALTGKADALEHEGRFDDARNLLKPVVDRGHEDAAVAVVLVAGRRD